ncbi:hypothetical protein L486_01800 [Kwoniella mangroviensis CBS 10435]|uniref:Uncharacterized protein n=1 Tax=Kwoniella mangroviensis CBS 10435 TaxID=1331196 RepID=A0A1B9J2W6_9TREE|nr:hypothetical protein L486_01800 [Kwoniella mangroviensis CBS 10435]
MSEPSWPPLEFTVPANTMIARTAIDSIIGYVRRGYTDDTDEGIQGKIAYLENVKRNGTTASSTVITTSRTLFGVGKSTSVQTAPMTKQDFTKIVSRNSHDENLGRQAHRVQEYMAFLNGSTSSRNDEMGGTDGGYSSWADIPVSQDQRDFDEFLERTDPELLGKPPKQ